MKTQTKLYILGVVLVVGLALFFMSRPEDKTTPNRQTRSAGDYAIVLQKVYTITSGIS